MDGIVPTKSIGTKGELHGLLHAIVNVWMNGVLFTVTAVEQQQFDLRGCIVRTIRCWGVALGMTGHASAMNVVYLSSGKTGMIVGLDRTTNRMGLPVKTVVRVP